MMPSEQAEFDDRSQQGRMSTPKPDPTVLTTEALLREISALRTLIDQRISATMALFDEKISDGIRGGAALKELFTAELVALKTAQTALRAADAELLDEKFEGRDKALVAALQAAKEAVDKANEATEKRFDALNEVLQQLNLTIALLIPRAEAESRMSDLDRRIGDVKEVVDKGFTGVDARQSIGRDSKADSRANLAIAISVGMGLLTMLTMIVINAMHAAGH